MMGARDLLELCSRNLLRRKTRTFLAVTGVLVGTCAIIVMLSIGFGLSKSYQEQIESYGNLHMIEIYGGGMGYGQGNKGVLTDRTIKEIERIKGVGAVTPIISEYMVVIHGKRVAQMEIRGIDIDVLERFNYGIQEGRLLIPSDKMGILFGNQTPYFFMDPKHNYWGGGEAEDVMKGKLKLTGNYDYGRKPQQGDEGERISYAEYDVKAVGVLDNPNDDAAYSAYMNIKDMERIQKELKKARRESSVQIGERRYDRALVYVGDINDGEKVSKTLREDMGYQTYSPGDWLAAMKETARMIQGILGGIGGISLLVAALGITNTMIMSIYERTREIGVMKVIGANLRDIRRLFLLEAGLIGFAGGVAGVVFSFLISLLMNTVLKDIISIALNNFGGGYGSAISIIPWWVVPAALTFATGIGILAGYHPAKRAMNMSALESLRNE
ncbi:MAG: ABC transporter permease [Anaerovoracaceae bacterium]|jgi:putative ABC transport system permease protein